MISFTWIYWNINTPVSKNFVVEAYWSGNHIYNVTWITKSSNFKKQLILHALIFIKESFRPFQGLFPLSTGEGISRGMELGHRDALTSLSRPRVFFITSSNRVWAHDEFKKLNSTQLEIYIYIYRSFIVKWYSYH
jgi:hypothetical protein